MYRDSFCYHFTLGVVTLPKQKKLIMVVLVLTTGLKWKEFEHTPQSSWNEGVDRFLLLYDLPNAMWNIESM